MTRTHCSAVAIPTLLTACAAIVLIGLPAWAAPDDQPTDHTTTTDQEGTATNVGHGQAENHPNSADDQPGENDSERPDELSKENRSGSNEAGEAATTRDATGSASGAHSTSAGSRQNTDESEPLPAESLVADFRTRKDIESPRHWMFELKFGPYKPDVDAESGLSGHPYRDVFECLPGHSCSKWAGYTVMSQAELDFQVWKGFGSLGIAGTIGYFRIKGKALQPEDPSVPYDPDSNPYIYSGDTTTMNLLPFVLQVVYRWDYAAIKWGVPIVPYVKGGAVCTVWWIENGNGDVARFGNGTKARGTTFGYEINLGIAFLLDVLEPSAAKTMDREIGINHSYLFAEFVHSQVRWAVHDRMRLGMPATFLAGLALEF